MQASCRDRASAANRSKRGTGSVRQRSHGVWEVRVVVGSGPARGRSIQRSFTVRGDAALAGRARRELVAEYGSARSDIRRTASAVTVGELLAPGACSTPSSRYCWSAWQRRHHAGTCRCCGMWPMGSWRNTAATGPSLGLRHLIRACQARRYQLDWWRLQARRGLTDDFPAPSPSNLVNHINGRWHEGA